MPGRFRRFLDWVNPVKRWKTARLVRQFKAAGEKQRAEEIKPAQAAVKSEPAKIIPFKPPEKPKPITTPKKTAEFRRPAAEAVPKTLAVRLTAQKTVPEIEANLKELSKIIEANKNASEQGITLTIQKILEYKNSVIELDLTAKRKETVLKLQQTHDEKEKAGLNDESIKLFKLSVAANELIRGLETIENKKSEYIERALLKPRLSKALESQRIAGQFEASMGEEEKIVFQKMLQAGKIKKVEGSKGKIVYTLV